MRERPCWSVSVGPVRPAIRLPPGAPRSCSALGRCQTLFPRLMVQSRGGTAASGWGYRSPEEVGKAGTGMAVRNVVTRCNSALTGHEVGRCKRIQSLYCLTCVAPVTSVRMTVEGRGRGQGRVSERVGAERMMQDISPARQEEPRGVGEEGHGRSGESRMTASKSPQRAGPRQTVEGGAGEPTATAPISKKDVCRQHGMVIRGPGGLERLPLPLDGIPVFSGWLVERGPTALLAWLVSCRSDTVRMICRAWGGAPVRVPRALKAAPRGSGPLAPSGLGAGH